MSFHFSGERWFDMDWLLFFFFFLPFPMGTEKIQQDRKLFKAEGQQAFYGKKIILRSVVHFCLITKLWKVKWER